VKDLGPAPAKPGVSISPDILGSFDSTLSELEQEVVSMWTTVLDTPFVDLATRTAAHFFTERSVRRFSERALDELIREVGAGSGALLLFRTLGTDAEVVAARNDRSESI